ncbi:MAG: GNAT family N-acetyltransferase [Corynebacteriales bacterium]|nr:GNAT family N-acetyltransferase [Mycobacteriales bacterium]
MTQLRQLSHAEFVEHLDELLAIYGAAMGYPLDFAVARRPYLRAHVNEPGFRAFAAFDADHIMGFTYGYLSRTDQWWHSTVRAGISAQTYAQWLPHSYELAELHVHPLHQGHGVGRGLLERLLDAVPRDAARTVLLSTPEVDGLDNAAWRLYRNTGFQEVARQFRFPGDARSFAILGYVLPDTVISSPN